MHELVYLWSKYHDVPQIVSTCASLACICMHINVHNTMTGIMATKATALTRQHAYLRTPVDINSTQRAVVQVHDPTIRSTATWWEREDIKTDRPTNRIFSTLVNTVRHPSWRWMTSTLAGVGGLNRGWRTRNLWTTWDCLYAPTVHCIQNVCMYALVNTDESESSLLSSQEECKGS